MTPSPLSPYHRFQTAMPTLPTTIKTQRAEVEPEWIQRSIDVRPNDYRMAKADAVRQGQEVREWVADAIQQKLVRTRLNHRNQEQPQ